MNKSHKNVQLLMQNNTVLSGYLSCKMFPLFSFLTIIIKLLMYPGEYRDWRWGRVSEKPNSWEYWKGVPCK